jgi:hypothetical protein
MVVFSFFAVAVASLLLWRMDENATVNISADEALGLCLLAKAL